MNRKTVKALLKNKKQEELLEIIAELTSFDPEGERWLLSYCETQSDETNQSFVAQSKVLNYWKVARAIISEANEYGGTYQEDEAWEALLEIGEIMAKTKTSWEFRRPIVDEMMEQLLLGNSGFDDILTDTCVILCQEKAEQLYLAEAFNKSNAQYAVVAANIYLNYGDKEHYDAIKKRNLYYEFDELNS